MKLICSVGISGCGKSTYYEKNLHDKGVKLVCPDDVRKALLGSVNDQSNGDLIFAECYRELRDYLERGYSVYWSATNLVPRYLKDIFNEALKVTDNVSFELIFFDASRSPELCKSRVKKDLDSGTDRSNTLITVTGDNGKPTDLIDVMSKRYIQNIDSGAFNNIITNYDCEVKHIK